MPITKKVYNIEKVKTLIDLNGNITNFDCKFTVSSKNQEPFDILCVSQTTLDNAENLEYKNVVDGVIQGNVLADQNVYQNYFLILKKPDNSKDDTPVDVEVEIDFKELPKVPKLPEQIQVNDNRDASALLKPKSNGMWWYFFIGAVIILGVFLLYNYLTPSKEEGDQKCSTEVIPILQPAVLPQPVQPVVLPQPVQPVVVPQQVQPVVVPQQVQPVVVHQPVQPVSQPVQSAVLPQPVSQPAIESVPPPVVQENKIQTSFRDSVKLTPPRVGRKLNESLLSRLRALPK